MLCGQEGIQLVFFHNRFVDRHELHALSRVTLSAAAAYQLFYDTAAFRHISGNNQQSARLHRVLPFGAVSAA